MGFLLHQSEKVLTISANPNAFNYTLCPEAEDHFELGNFFTTAAKSLSFCVDLEDMIAPQLSFDLTQFRENNGAFPELFDNSTITRYSWTSENESFSETIVGQSEGVSVNHSTNLPTNFKGKVELEFFHNFGFILDEDLLDFDVSLLDNLMIVDGVVNTTEVKKVDTQIFPNPSTGIFEIVHSELPTFIELRNIHG